MADIVRLLPDHVANQIAAGEVVQRPASAVKELMENSIDADSKTIELIIQDAGRSLIQIVDDGKGMSNTDLRLAFERHATSKIYSTDDIFSIKTKGFRGEALASIAAVAQVEVKSKLEGEELGSKLIIEGGEFKEQNPEVTSTGTSLSVRNLFFNVPARRNFLKSNNVEFRHIQDEFLRLALAHENIEFNLSHNGSEVYKLPASSRKKRILQIFGRKLEPQLLAFAESTDYATIKGFVGKPEFAKKSRNEQFLFVNNRYIRSAFLNRAIQDAYSFILGRTRYPSFFLFLSINPEHIDINIHPSKTEIKFDNESLIYNLLRAGVKKALGQFEVSSTIDFDTNPTWTNIPSKPKKAIGIPQVKVNPSFNPFQRESPAKQDMKPFFEQDYVVEVEQETEQVQLHSEEDEPKGIEVLEWKGNWLVAIVKNELCVLNRHRAHERLIYEKLITEQSSTLSQRLLFPIELELNPEEINTIKIVETQLVALGIEVNFEGNTCEILALPEELNSEKVKDFFDAFLSAPNLDSKKELSELINRKLAKSMAIRSNEYMPKPQLKLLVQKLFQLDDPAYSPSGKRIFLPLDAGEIEKKLD